MRLLNKIIRWHKRIYFYLKAIRRRRKGEGTLEKSPYKDILKKIGGERSRERQVKYRDVIVKAVNNKYMYILKNNKKW